MNETRVSMTELRQNLANLINRAAYGGERIVLVSHGEPKAAIVGIQDLRRLEANGSTRAAQKDQNAHVLAAADLLRERIRHWQETHGIIVEDSVETLQLLRESRDDELSGLQRCT